MKFRTRKSSNLSVSLPEDMQELLRRAAADDNRSVSSLVTALVGAYLIREGYMSAHHGGEYVHSAPPHQTRLQLSNW